MTTLTLHDFELEIDAGDGSAYPLAVLRSPAGAARGASNELLDSVATVTIRACVALVVHTVRADLHTAGGASTHGNDYFTT